MKDRVLIRFDTIVAICALLTSSVAAGAMVYQTKVIEQQFAAAVWPYLSIENDNSADSLEIRVTNDGAGPALVRSAQLQIDGKPVSGWGALVDLALHGPLKRAKAHIQAASVDGATTVRAGDSRVLFDLQSKNTRVISALHQHRISLAFCYCSINGTCWTHHETASTTASSLPQRVSQCGVGPIITAGSLQIP